MEEGDIHLKLSDSYPIKVSIDAIDVIPDAKFSEHGKVGYSRVFKCTV